jgi:hypothetical protein
MQVFLSVSGQQSGPFSLLNVREMKQLGSIPADTLAWCEKEADWLLVDDFLARHPVSFPGKPSVRRAMKEKSPSRLRGLAGALLMSIVGGGIIAGFVAVTGALFGILWWGMAWAIGTAAKHWARAGDQIIGLFAFGATLLGIFISAMGFAAHPNAKITAGPIMFISFPGSLWFAFRTGSRP